MRLRSLAVLPLLLVCSSCGGGDGAPSRSTEMEEYSAEAGAAPPPVVDARAPGSIAPVSPDQKSAPASAARGAPELPQGDQADTASTPSMIIRNGDATVEVDSLEPAVARVQQLARQAGGYVANTTLQTGDRQVRRATLELKIPAARFDQAVSGLRPLGEVESVNVTAEDVGEEFTDVTARVANARRLEERLVTLLATRTGRLEDVLAVERELARVREEIERYEGRLRYLRSRVALSTLTVNLHEPEPVIGDHPGSNPIAEAFGQAWRNFVGFVAGLIAALGFLVPLGLVLGAAWRLFRWARGPGGGGGRRWFRRAPQEPPATGGTPGPTA